MLQIKKRSCHLNLNLESKSYFATTDGKKRNSKKKETVVSINNLKKKTDIKKNIKKVTLKTIPFGVVIRVKDGVAFARDLGFASFGELAVFIPSPSRLNLLKLKQNIKYVNGMVVGIEDKLTSIVIFGNERLIVINKL